TFFGEALETGYYPEAYLGLARIAARRKENAIARRHLLSALDMEKTLPDDAVGPIPLFQATVNHLMQLLEPREGCKAWIVTFSHLQNPHNPVVLRGCRLLIYARTQEEAEGFVDEMLGAMQQKVAPLQAKKLHWAPAPRDQQPIRPVLPGIQSVLAGS
ncbi:MAG: hypothetical protein ACREKL_00970, partial [Chthoniobacterales bacterium]